MEAVLRTGILEVVPQVWSPLSFVGFPLSLPCMAQFCLEIAMLSRELYPPPVTSRGPQMHGCSFHSALSLHNG